MNTYTTTVLWASNEYLVEYSVIPREIRNLGHPDNRLPDIPIEIEILSITHNEKQVDLPPCLIKFILESIGKSINHVRYSS